MLQQRQILAVLGVTLLAGITAIGATPTLGQAQLALPRTTRPQSVPNENLSRGKNQPSGHHEQNYEIHFGPLWYAFAHKNCWFIALYSDEGDALTGKKNRSKILSING